MTIVDRMNYISPIANEIAWHHAVEKLLGIELTPRCKYLRTILAELMRHHDHLLCVGAAALDLGAFTAFLYAFYQREKIYDICRVRVGAAVPSELHPRRRRAVRHRTTPGSPRFATSSRDFPKAHADIVRLLNRNRIFIDRTQGHRRAVRRKTPSTRACTGPIARASGVVRDLRKDEPYLAYQDFDFKVVCVEGRRLLRPLPGAHGRDAGEPEDHSTRRSRTCRPGRSTSIVDSKAVVARPSRRSIAASKA